MGTTEQKAAAAITGPIQGDVNVDSLVADTATAEIDLTAFAGRFVDITVDAPFFILFGVTGMAEPDEDLTTGAGQCGKAPADGVVPHFVVLGVSDFFRVKSLVTAKLRYWPSSRA